MLEIQRLLKHLTTEKFYKVLKMSKLSDTEYRLLQEFLLRHNSRNSVCELLHISPATFTHIKKIALTKVQLLFDKMISQNA